MSLKIHAIDLFCGIGGLTHGLILSSIDVKAGFDIDAKCKYAYKANNFGAAFVAADICNLTTKSIQPYMEDADITIFVGCAPCQPFSSHNRKSGSLHVEDCSLIQDFSRLVLDFFPHFVFMENVPGLRFHNTFKEFRHSLNKAGYHISFDVVSCADYGVPQDRKRLVFFASRIGEIRFPKPVDTRATVKEFIYNLPPIKDGESWPQDLAHTTLPLSEKNKKRILQSRPGGSWKDWDDDLVADCQRNAHYPAPYGRMMWNTLAPTITTQFCYYSTGRFGHPTQHRTISVREAALLQTFPKDYRLIDEQDPLPVGQLARQVGNAVPVKLAKSIGDAIVKAVNGR